jgi:DNA-binding protein HU-beta
VNKSELIDHVAPVASVGKQTALSAVDAAHDGIIATFDAGNTISLLGFEAFARAPRAARKGRNPGMGAQLDVGAFKGVRFTHGPPFKVALNAKSGAKLAASAKAARAPADAARTLQAMVHPATVVGGR